MPLGIAILITAVTAGGLGLLIGWLLGKSRAAVAPADSRLENELRQQLTQREAEISATREQLTQTKTSLATAQANQNAAAEPRGLATIRLGLGETPVKATAAPEDGTMRTSPLSAAVASAKSVRDDTATV